MADLRDDDGLEALCNGDEAAFVALVREHHSVLLRVAMVHVRDRAVAEEVVQETWLGALTGVERFQGRSSVRTWLVRIAVNIARRRAYRERRCLPFSAVGPAGEAAAAVEDIPFTGAGTAARPGRWASRPVGWQTPEERVLGNETRDVLRAAIAALPPAQRLVVTLRDVEGWPAEEVCAALALTPGNQRVLLHRARAGVRDALAAHLSPAERAA
jgi:RNA polymerase sigma-70 factor (ECF subfamily)